MATIGIGMRERNAHRRLWKIRTVVKAVYNEMTKNTMLVVVVGLIAVLLYIVHGCIQLSLRELPSSDTLNTLGGLIGGGLLGLLVPRPGDQPSNKQITHNEEDDIVRQSSRPEHR